MSKEPQMVTMLNLAEDCVAYIKKMPQNSWGSKKIEMRRKAGERITPHSMPLRTSIFPYRTGNMRESTTAQKESETRSYIVVGGTKAPYAPYTQFPWTDGRFGGKPNPNEGWMERLVRQRLVDFIQQNYQLGKIDDENRLREFKTL